MPAACGQFSPDPANLTAGSLFVSASHGLARRVRLCASSDKWQSRFTVKAPVDGRVFLLSFLQRTQTTFGAAELSDTEQRGSSANKAVSATSSSPASLCQRLRGEFIKGSLQTKPHVFYPNFIL